MSFNELCLHIPLATATILMLCLPQPHHIIVKSGTSQDLLHATYRMPHATCSVLVIKHEMAQAQTRCINYTSYDRKHKDKHKN